MKPYFFYFWTAENVSTGLEVVHLGADADASATAAKLLANHPSCAHVEVWEGDRQVLLQRRPGTSPGPVTL